jgi:NADH-quinone oxidoreductase subunit C
VCRAEVTIEVAAADLIAVCKDLHDQFAFHLLIDLCGVDYLGYGDADWDTHAANSGFSRAQQTQTFQDFKSERYPQRFAVVYHLLSTKNNQRLRLRSYAEGEPCKITSVVNIWSVANWYEREAFDLFGILFEGHPDLRRILTDYGFIGHPMRKDFPLTGHVEMRYDETQGRVIYEPVSIEYRPQTARVIRDDARSS